MKIVCVLDCRKNTKTTSGSTEVQVACTMRFVNLFFFSQAATKHHKESKRDENRLHVFVLEPIIGVRKIKCIFWCFRQNEFVNSATFIHQHHWKVMGENERHCEQQPKVCFILPKKKKTLYIKCALWMVFMVLFMYKNWRKTKLRMNFFFFFISPFLMYFMCLYACFRVAFCALSMYTRARHVLFGELSGLVEAICKESKHPSLAAIEKEEKKKQPDGNASNNSKNIFFLL